MILPPVIGHRGAAARAPENTLAGFRRAKALGCDWVEFDVRLTADGALVICHDDRLDRTTDGKGRLADKSLQQIRQYDAGAWFGPQFRGERVPTLDEALTLCAELALGANIEIKAERGLARATAAAVSVSLARLGLAAPSVLVSSFAVEVLAAMRDLAPKVPRGLLLRLLSRSWAATAERLDCTTVNFDHRRLSMPLISAIRAAGYPLLAYTVNDPGRARQLFDWGVTSVFSDVPDIILSMIAAHQPERPVRPGVPGFATLQPGAVR
ncbi:MAG TPA: glycerophosphoryl diester phosphodiesterase [Stellaceae bacterium]|jgi:glycerophosphoryl diester phosphodiesterase|nr:glycerophosphoryl diester phosphodiesterase [Stellaceae bacterium]